MAKKVTPYVVKSTLEAMEGRCLVPHRYEWKTVLSTGERRPNWISLANGVLNLDELLERWKVADSLRDVSTAEILRPHSPDWWCGSTRSFTFDPLAECPRWKAFLERNLEEDRDLIRLLQEWMGYLLFYTTDVQKCLILHGDGANGKSVICAVAQALVGSEETSHVGLEQLGERFEATSMLGKALNVVAEIGEFDRDIEGKFKALVSGDPMSFQQKYRDSIQARSTAKQMFATNYLPRFKDHSRGVWRRILLISLKATIADSERVIGMDKSEWLEASGEMPGIFRWALEGLYRLALVRNWQFTTSEASNAALHDWRYGCNPVAMFVDERCELDPEACERVDVVFERYKAWCIEGNYRALTKENFGKAIGQFGVARIRGKASEGRPWLYAGVRLATNAILS